MVEKRVEESAANPRERPILFSGEMVRAILEGRKTQTRRVIQPQPLYQGRESFGDSWLWKKTDKEWFSGVTTEQLVGEHGLCYPGRCPYGQPGDRLWVRESMGRWEDGEWFYKADTKVVTVPSDQIDDVTAMRVWAHHKESPHCPSIHMPRWASRLTLEITKIRVELIQQITNEDARAEGVYVCPHRGATCGMFETGFNQCFGCAYRLLWNQINGPRGFGWEANPWVWVIEFRRERGTDASS